MAYAHGYNSVVRIGNTNMCCHRWSVEELIEPLDVTGTACAQGFVNYVPGAADCHIILEGGLGINPGEDPFDVLNLRDLQDIHIGGRAKIVIEPDSLLNPVGSWQFDNALVTDWEMLEEARGLITWKLEALGKASIEGAVGPHWFEPNM